VLLKHVASNDAGHIIEGQAPKTILRLEGVECAGSNAGGGGVLARAAVVARRVDPLKRVYAWSRALCGEAARNDRIRHGLCQIS
jgi:hypothetical protein